MLWSFSWMQIFLKIDTLKPAPNITVQWQRPGDVRDVSKSRLVVLSKV
jgi:hypothetical protein